MTNDSVEQVFDFNNISGTKIYGTNGGELTINATDVSATIKEI